MSNYNKNKRDIMEKIKLRFLEINNLSPFPIIDTEVIQYIDNKLKDDNLDYDDEPVICCSHCKNLALIIDDDDNDVCPLCTNSLNEIEVHRTIYHYLNKYPNKWNKNGEYKTSID